MADDYIDNTETLIYGPKLVSAVTRALEGPLADAPAEVRAFVRWSAAQVGTATDAMSAAMRDRTASGHAQQDQAEVSASARDGARRAIRGLYKHLDASVENETWTGDPTRFLPGGLRSVPRGGRALLAMLDAVRVQLRADDTVPAQREFLRRLDAAHRTLATEVPSSETRNADAREGLSEQAAVKLSWLRAYRAASLAVEAALAFVERSDLLPQLVPHLAAPSSPAPKTPASPVEPPKP